MAEKVICVFHAWQDYNSNEIIYVMYRIEHCIGSHYEFCRCMVGNGHSNCQFHLDSSSVAKIYDKIGVLYDRVYLE